MSFHLSNLEIQRLELNAQIPKQAKDGDAGFDLYAIESFWIKPGERALVRTGISMAIPKGFYGRISPRSGLALRSGIDVMAGVIDCGYRSEIKVLLINLSNGNEEQSFFVEAGARIAQIIFESCATAQFKEVEELSNSDRGVSGFGASGV